MQLLSLLATALAITTHQANAADVIAKAGFLPAAPVAAPTAPPQLHLARRDFASCATSLISQYGPPQPTGAVSSDLVAAGPANGQCSATFPQRDSAAILSYATVYRDFLAKLSTLHATENCGGKVGFSLTGDSCSTVHYIFTGNASASTATLTNPPNIPTQVIIAGAAAPAAKAGAAVAISFVAAAVMLVL